MGPAAGHLTRIQPRCVKSLFCTAIVEFTYIRSPFPRLESPIPPPRLASSISFMQTKNLLPIIVSNPNFAASTPRPYYSLVPSESSPGTVVQVLFYPPRGRGAARWGGPAFCTSPYRKVSCSSNVMIRTKGRSLLPAAPFLVLFRCPAGTLVQTPRHPCAVMPGLAPGPCTSSRSLEHPLTLTPFQA